MTKKIFIAGHNGMVGSALMRMLDKGSNHLIICNRQQLDLTHQQQVHDFFLTEKPDEVYLAAAKVGGIYANNTYPAEFIYQNLLMEANVIHSAWQAGTNKLLFLGSSCIYPKLANQPMSEFELLKGALEPTNEPYAIAKIAGIKLCESYNRQYGVDYRSVMPTNLFGPGDNYHPENSHVVPGLIHRFYQAKVEKLSSVNVWGSGNVLREFLYVDDLAKACIHVMSIDQARYKKHIQLTQSHINIGSGEEVSIRELAENIKAVVGYEGEINFDSTKPDGASRKLLDSELVHSLGWRPSITLFDGLKAAYNDYLCVKT